MQISGQKIKSIMIEKGLFPNDICCRIGITRAAYNRIITGTTLPNRVTAYKMTAALGVPVQDILKDDFKEHGGDYFGTDK